MFVRNPLLINLFRKKEKKTNFYISTIKYNNCDFSIKTVFELTFKVIVEYECVNTVEK